MERSSTSSTRVALLVLAAGFAVVLWRAATLPLSPAEAEAWDYFVRPPARTLLVTPGAWSGAVYGFVAKRSVGLFRLSEFSLRFPSILGSLLYFYALYRVAGRRLWVLTPFAAAPAFLGCFYLSGGAGLTVGLCSLALAFPENAGIWLGLAVAACPQIGFVPATVAAGLVSACGFWRGMERVVIPAMAIGFVLLILPLSHAGPPVPLPDTPGEREAALRAAIGVLRGEAGKRPARIAVSPAAKPAVEFYRERDRQRDWAIGSSDPEYFLWVTPDHAAAGAPPARILYQHAGVVLARSSLDGSRP